jgi:Zn-dependent protease with chaperone function
VLFILLWVLLRSVFIKFPPPQGYILERHRYPVLWAEVDQLSKILSTPPIHQILLTAEMNAALMQTPRFGLFSPSKNTLIIGLELLLALSTQQTRAVLAHELAHTSELV